MEDLYEFRGGRRLKPFRLSAKGIHDLAVDVVTNKVYIANDERITESFPVLVLLDRKNLPDAVLKRTGAFYERMSEAGRTAINGRPMFFSVRLLHRDDLTPLLDEMARLEELLTSRN